MSGGHFDYRDSSLKTEIFGWASQTTEQAMKLNPLEDKEISGIVFDMFQLLHEFDWAVCGDTSMEHYHEEVQKFKNKWLNSEAKDRIRYVIDNSLKDLKEELYISFELTEKEE